MQRSLILPFLMGQCIFIDSQHYEYHYIKKEKNWTEAQQYCRENHTDLATVINMNDMWRLLNKSPGNRSEAWIGLYDPTGVNRTWHWSLPGVEFNESRTKWNIGEPTDIGKTKSENCGRMYKNLSWIDTGCEHKKQFVCYNETDATPKYYLIKENMTWQKAQSYCRENYTDLISGLTQLQNEELMSVMSSAESAYFGLFRDTWRWSNGGSFSFRHWQKEFNNTEYNTGQCAIAVFGDEGRWKNASCATEKPFICYDDKVILIEEKMNWEDALYHCRDHYHDLVSITNLDEQRWIQEKVKRASTDYVWMGLRYTCTLDFWFWVSDEVVSYKNWASDGQMDDCDMSGAMETEGQHRWSKRNDSEEFSFICLKK